MQIPRFMQCILAKGKELTGAGFHKYGINHLQVQLKSMLLQNICQTIANDARALTHYDTPKVPSMATLQPNTLPLLLHLCSVCSKHMMISSIGNLDAIIIADWICISEQISFDPLSYPSTG